MTSLWKIVLYSVSGTVLIKLTSLVTPCPLERRKEKKKPHVATVHFSFCKCSGVIFAIVPGPHSKRIQEKFHYAEEDGRLVSYPEGASTYHGRGENLSRRLGKPNTAEELSIRTLL